MAGEVLVDEERLGFFLLTCVQCDQLVRVPGSVSFKAVGRDGRQYLLKAGSLLPRRIRLIPVTWCRRPSKR